MLSRLPPGNVSPKSFRAVRHRLPCTFAHGGSAQEWNEEVRHVADEVDLAMPTEVAFGMAMRSSMQTAGTILFFFVVTIFMVRFQRRFHHWRSCLLTRRLSSSV